MVCPIAKRLVTTAKPLPQAPRGRLTLMKLVAAAGTMNTLEPNRAADIHSPKMDGANSGSAAPTDNTAMVAAIAKPSARPVKTRCQTIGASNVMLPKTLHMIDVTAAADMPDTGFCANQAMMKVM